MSLKERLTHDLEDLDDSQLEQVATYLSFLKFQSRSKHPPMLDDAQLASLYAEFADEDRELAEAGMDNYAQVLQDEDKK